MNSVWQKSQDFPKIVVHEFMNVITVTAAHCPPAHKSAHLTGSHLPL
jgi:hypothetical protein